MFEGRRGVCSPITGYGAEVVGYKKYVANNRAGQELVPKGTSSWNQFILRNFRWNEVPFWKVELVHGTSSYLGFFYKVPSSSSFANLYNYFLLDTECECITYYFL